MKIEKKKEGERMAETWEFIKMVEKKKTVQKCNSLLVEAIKFVLLVDIQVSPKQKYKHSNQRMLHSNRKIDE